MKRFISLFIALILCALAFASCTKPAGDGIKNSHIDTQEGDNSGENSGDDVMEEPANPTTDFEYIVILDETSGESHIMIKRYVGESKRVIIPEKIGELPVGVIGAMAFFGSAIEYVYIPNTVTKISMQAFSHCKELVEVRFGKGIVEIGLEAFFKCESLEKAILPEQLKEIGSKAFQECSSITEVFVPKTVNIWCGDEFVLCISLKIVTFENGLETIGGFASFAGCTSLETVTVPASVTEIGNITFSSCSSLKNVRFMGDAPTLSSEYTFGEPNKNIDIYYDKNTSGWDTTSLKDDYNLISY